VTIFENPSDWFSAHARILRELNLGLIALGFGVDLVKGNPRHIGETATNIATFFGSKLVGSMLTKSLQLLGLTLLVKISTWSIPNYLPWTIPTNVFTIAGAFLLVDLCYYWRHRWGHEINLLWCEHSVHHSSGELNLSTGLRSSLFTAFYGWAFFLPLTLFGFPINLLFGCFIINQIFNLYVHGDSIGKIPVLDSFINTPSNHRVHHGLNPQYKNKNYGGVFIFWDKIFGTYEAEIDKPDYGLSIPIGTRNPFLINILPFVGMYEKFQKQRNWKRKLTAIFGSPGALE
jgi:alkylglycerol monooxygenase